MNDSWSENTTSEYLKASRYTFQENAISAVSLNRNALCEANIFSLQTLRSLLHNE